MSKSSIKFCLLAISCLAIVCALDIYGEAIRPSKRVTEVEKLEQHQMVQDEIYRHLSQNDTYLRQNFTWSGIGSTNANGLDTIYLPFKFSNTDYFVSMISSTVSLIGSVTLSDSSFSVVMYSSAGAHAVDYRYIVIGSIE